MASKLPEDKERFTVAEVAEIVGVSPTRIRQILLDGRTLKAEKFGQAWVIHRRNLKKWLELRGE